MVRVDSRAISSSSSLVASMYWPLSSSYWLITFVGYAINLFAAPAVGLAGSRQWAAALVLAERIGRALRKPTVEAMLSYTTNELGKGTISSASSTHRTIRYHPSRHT